MCQHRTIKVIDGRVNPPHYLIIFGNEKYRTVKPIKIRQRRVKNPTEARAIGFFYIAQYLNQFLGITILPSVIFHIGYGTVVAPRSMKTCLEKGEAHGNQSLII